jgi:uncharacterized protein (DUF983 family)
MRLFGICDRFACNARSDGGAVMNDFMIFLVIMSFIFFGIYFIWAAPLWAIVLVFLLMSR